MILRVSAVVFLVLAGLLGPRSGPLPAQSARDDDFAEFEDDDSEFDFEVLDEEEEDECEYHVTYLFAVDYYLSSWGGGGQGGGITSW